MFAVFNCYSGVWRYYRMGISSQLNIKIWINNITNSFWVILRFFRRKTLYSSTLSPLSSMHFAKVSPSFWPYPNDGRGPRISVCFSDDLIVGGTLNSAEWILQFCKQKISSWNFAPVTMHKCAPVLRSSFLQLSPSNKFAYYSLLFILPLQM